MTDETQATKPDEPPQKPQAGDRVFARPKTEPFGRTGTISKVEDGVHSKTYIIDLDGAGQGYFSRNVIFTADDLELLDTFDDAEAVDEMISTLEQVKTLVGDDAGGSA